MTRSDREIKRRVHQQLRHIRHYSTTPLGQLCGCTGSCNACPNDQRTCAAAAELNQLYTEFNRDYWCGSR